MSRRRRKNPKPRTTLAPEYLERREKEREGWRARAVEERQQGIRQTDAGARWKLAAETGTAYRPSSDWRSKPATPGQVRELRRLGLSVVAHRTRGEASDAIEKARGRNGRRSR